MSKKTIVQIPTVVERIYKHKGVSVPVRINFKTRTISLVELHPTEENTKVKKWVFAGRELEYMQGWKDILEAMTVAIDSAGAELEEYQQQKERAAIELMDEIYKREIEDKK